MNNLPLNIALLIIGFVSAGVITHFLLKGKSLINMDSVKEKAQKIISEKSEEASQIISETTKRTEQRRSQLLSETKQRQSHINKVKESLKNREELIKKREDRIRQKRLVLVSEKEFLSSAQNAIEQIEKESLEKLTFITKTSTDDLKNEIIQKYVEDLKSRNADQMHNLEENLKEDANKKAKKLIITTIQRLSSPTSVESRAVHIEVPHDHIKGKIIGSAAKNIIHLENLLAVDIVINDLPNTISISAFNLVNRRIAEKAIERLIKFRGNITENIVDKAVEKAEKEIDDELFALGRKALQKLGISLKNTDSELVKIIGRLQYRTSYGQNIMKHSMEVAWVAAMLGGELGLNIDTCRISGFLHDLGKAIDQNPDVQGAHDFLTKELMEKYKFTPEEVHAAWTHHGSESPSSSEALLVQAADAVSACRPGARQESIEKYVEKIIALEETAQSFEGVRTSYAMSAGRELRVFVDPEVIGDEKLDDLARSVASKIEEDLTYPGSIKVNIIRRTQHVEIAK